MLHFAKKILVLFSVATLTLSLDAMAGQWQSVDKVKGTGVYVDDLFRYEGGIRNGTWHGKGTLIYANGNRYVGGFVAGKKSGAAVSTYGDGAKYEGEYLNDQRHGKGTYTFASGARYVGEFVAGKYSGAGVFSSPSGEKYEGEYLNDERHGRGTLISATGDRYVGSYVAGQKSGRGEHTFGNGDKYEGEYLDGDRHGKGTYTFASGARYVGEYVAGEYSGTGILTMVNGTTEEGTFLNGKFIAGVRTNENGQKIAVDTRVLQGTAVAVNSSGSSPVVQVSERKRACLAAYQARLSSLRRKYKSLYAQCQRLTAAGNSFCYGDSSMYELAANLFDVKSDLESEEAGSGCDNVDDGQQDFRDEMAAKFASEEAERRAEAAAQRREIAADVARNSSSSSSPNNAVPYMPSAVAGALKLQQIQRDAERYGAGQREARAAHKTQAMASSDRGVSFSGSGPSARPAAASNATPPPQVIAAAPSGASTSGATEPASDPNPYQFDMSWRQVGEASEPAREVSCSKATTFAKIEMERNAAATNAVLTSASTACVCTYTTISGYYPQWRCMIYARQKGVRKSGPSDGVSR